MTSAIGLVPADVRTHPGLLAQEPIVPDADLRQRTASCAPLHAKPERKRLTALKLTCLFFVTAVAEIVGCYLPWLVIRQGKSGWLLLPAALALALFAWLLSFHPTAAGRTYAAYGGMYIAVALLWLRLVDGVALSRFDYVGAGFALLGMAVIAFQPAS